MSDREMSPLSLPACMYSSEPASSNSSDCPTSVKRMDMMLVKEEHATQNYEQNVVNDAFLYHRSPPNYVDAVYQNGACAYSAQSNIPVYVNSYNNTTNTNRTQNGVVKRKRIRTAFTTNQLQDLEDQYRVNRYLERDTRIFLSRKLNVSERVIKIWFQNRRMKEKKDRAECQVVDSCVPASTSTQNYEPPLPVYNIIPQANNGLMSCDSFMYDHQAVNVVAPMMVEQDGLLPRSTELPTATEAVHFNRYPHSILPPYESEVSSTVFSDFSQYCDSYNNE